MATARAASRARGQPLGMDRLVEDEDVVGEGIASAEKRGTRKMLVRRRKQKVESPMGVLCAMIVEHQLGLSINLLLLLALTHFFFPRARDWTRRFFEMSYYHSEKDVYTRGPNDGYYVIFWLVIFTGLRVAVMEYVLKPFAQLNGIKSRKGLTRFAEQGWMFIYYSIAWSVGMYLIYNSPYFFNLRELWTNYPEPAIGGLMKWYYLVQLAFWLQQLFVVNIEKRRKDHWQMFAHHIFTSVLMVTSYGHYQTRVGNVILCTMDIADVLLALAKMLNYLNYSTACDATFGVFIATWFVTRHVFFNAITYAIYTERNLNLRNGFYDIAKRERIAPGGGTDIWRNVLHSLTGNELRAGGLVAMNTRIRIVYIGLLLALQVLTLIWFGMIVRVAYRVIGGKGAQDSRSDDEGDDEEAEEEEVEIEVHDAPRAANGQVYIVEEVGGEAVNLARTHSAPALPVRRSSRRVVSKASGISIPDKKEILGRIGCDKPT